ncbi:hypothetical protein GF337_06310 [candidate division KSB1 bacterium]|nr:hypothetical protein [candidate division KSB1 bacterium]
MNMIISFLIILMLVISVDYVFAQENELEKLLEEEAEYSDQSDLLERLFEFRENPIDINEADLKEIMLLPWLSVELANAIISYRDQNGKFNEVEDLLNVPGFSKDMFEDVREYLTVINTSRFKGIEIKHRSRISRRLNKSIGFMNGTYFDSPNKYYNRLNIKYNNKINVGLVFEKDSGERRLNDLSLYYLKYSDPIEKYSFIIGNYRLEFGQGLTFWNPYGYRKSANPVYSAIKRERGLLGYQMVDENASLFGAASQICLKIYQLLIFFSRSQLDATRYSDDLVTSFYESGYHRTPLEIAKKDVLQENLIGGRFVVIPSATFKIGTTYYRSIYDLPIQNQDIIRNHFDFSGKSNYIYSADFDLMWRQFRAFGELAQSKSKGMGVIAGTNIRLNPLNFLVLYRKYSKSFHSLHGSGFGERGGNPANERGFYYGFKYNFLKNATLAVYYDIYKYPWRTYYENLPTDGNDFLCQLEYKINSATLITVRYKNKQRQLAENTADYYDRDTKRYFDQLKQNVRLQLDYKPISNLKLRGRLEKSTYSLKRKSSGMLIYQDIRYKYSDIMTVYSRLTFFDTEDYESRVYQFENDVPYVLTNQMLYGKGSRWYICMVFSLFGKIRCSIKYSVTDYEFVDSIGSAQDKILDNSLRNLNVQLETRF